MKVHHATQKKAEKHSLLITVHDKQGVFEAHWPEFNQRYYHTDAKALVDMAVLNQMLHLEYPGLSVEWDDDNRCYVVLVQPTDGDLEEIGRQSKLPDLDAVLEMAREAGIDVDALADEFDDEQTGSVVKAKYKLEYAARGNASHCGDWLAQTLVDAFTVQHPVTKVGKDGKERTVKGRKQFDCDAFAKCLELNGVELSGKWADQYHQKASKGWQGRFRMSGRLLLEQEVLASGWLALPDGQSVAAPEEWLDAMSEKHSK